MKQTLANQKSSLQDISSVTTAIEMRGLNVTRDLIMPLPVALMCMAFVNPFGQRYKNKVGEDEEDESPHALDMGSR